MPNTSSIDRSPRHETIAVVCLEGGVYPPERSAKCVVEDGGAHVEEGLHGAPVPAHLLLLDLRFDRISLTALSTKAVEIAIRHADAAHSRPGCAGWHEDIRSDY